MLLACICVSLLIYFKVGLFLIFSFSHCFLESFYGKRSLGPIPKGCNPDTKGTHLSAVCLCKTTILNINTHLLVIFMQKKMVDASTIHKALFFFFFFPIALGKSSVMLNYCRVEKEQYIIFVKKNNNRWKILIHLYRLFTDFIYLLFY